MSEKKPTILMVDGDALQREAMRRVLRAAGYEVLEAKDYRSAEDTHRLHSGGIDLLLTAISLPGGNGYELANALKNAAPGIKAIFVTGEAGSKVSKFYNVESGDPRSLRRPFRPADLIERVKVILAAEEEAASASG